MRTQRRAKFIMQFRTTLTAICKSWRCPFQIKRWEMLKAHASFKATLSCRQTCPLLLRRVTNSHRPERCQQYRRLGQRRQIKLTVAPSEHLDVIDGEERDLTIDEGSEAKAQVRVKAKDVPGGAALTLSLPAGKNVQPGLKRLSVCARLCQA